MKRIVVIFGLVSIVGALVATGVVYATRPTLTEYVALGDSIAEGRGATVEHRFGYVPVFFKF